MINPWVTTAKMTSQIAALSDDGQLLFNIKASNTPSCMKTLIEKLNVREFLQMDIIEGFLTISALILAFK